MAEAFQFGAQRDVVVNLPVKDDSGVAIFGKDGLIAMVQVDDFQARRAQREQMRLKHALLVGTAVNQCGRGLPDSFRRRAPVFSGKPGDSAQLPAPSFSRESFARCHLALEKNSPIAVYLVYQSYRNRRLREAAIPQSTSQRPRMSLITFAIGASVSFERFARPFFHPIRLLAGSEGHFQSPGRQYPLLLERMSGEK